MKTFEKKRRENVEIITSMLLFIQIINENIHTTPTTNNNN